MNPDAAASLREGLEETITINRLGIAGTLARTLGTTNPMESTIDIVRAHAANVKNWNADRRSTRDGHRADMRLRWAAAGMLAAEAPIPPGQRLPATPRPRRRPPTPHPSTPPHTSHSLTRRGPPPEVPRRTGQPLDRGLHQQAHTETGHLLQHLPEVTLRPEQVVDLGVDALQKGYSGRHGCGFLSLLARLREEPTPVVDLHRGLDATKASAS